MMVLRWIQVQTRKACDVHVASHRVTDVGMLHQFQPLEVRVADKFWGMHETDSDKMLVFNIGEVTLWDSQSPKILPIPKGIVRLGESQPSGKSPHPF